MRPTWNQMPFPDTPGTGKNTTGPQAAQQEESNLQPTATLLLWRDSKTFSTFPVSAQPSWWSLAAGAAEKGLRSEILNSPATRRSGSETDDKMSRNFPLRYVAGLLAGFLPARSCDSHTAPGPTDEPLNRSRTANVARKPIATDTAVARTTRGLASITIRLGIAGPWLAIRQHGGTATPQGTRRLPQASRPPQTT